MNTTDSGSFDYIQSGAVERRGENERVNIESEKDKQKVVRSLFRHRATSRKCSSDENEKSAPKHTLFWHKQRKNIVSERRHAEMWRHWWWLTGKRWRQYRMPLIKSKTWNSKLNQNIFSDVRPGHQERWRRKICNGKHLLMLRAFIPTLSATKKPSDSISIHKAISEKEF